MCYQIQTAGDGVQVKPSGNVNIFQFPLDWSADLSFSASVNFF